MSDIESSSSDPLDKDIIFMKITEINPFEFRLYLNLVNLKADINQTHTIDPDTDEDVSADNENLDSAGLKINDWMNIEDENDINPYARNDFEYVEEEEEEEKNDINGEEKKDGGLAISKKFKILGIKA